MAKAMKSLPPPADILIVEYPKARVSQFEMPHPTPSEWERFRGNNHEYVRTDRHWGGAVSFAHHLGKPLSDHLWQDLTERFDVQRIRIYGPNAERWCDAPPSIAYITLDDAGNVTDIRVSL